MHSAKDRLRWQLKMKQVLYDALNSSEKTCYAQDTFSNFCPNTDLCFFFFNHMDMIQK